MTRTDQYTARVHATSAHALMIAIDAITDDDLALALREKAILVAQACHDATDSGTLLREIAHTAMQHAEAGDDVEFAAMMDVIAEGREDWDLVVY